MFGLCHLLTLFLFANSEGSCDATHMRRLDWTFADHLTIRLVGQFKNSIVLT